MIKKINLADKFYSFDEIYVPKIVGELNGQYIKLVKCLGEYIWHSHKDEDEMFMVVKGSFKILLRDKVIELSEGEFCIIPHGVEHKPVADHLCEIIVFEPATTRNTGDINHKFSIEPEDLDKI